MSKYAFGIFEGGGAKGICHVGAAKAVEQEGYGFVGVAGTSAGAIVAALIAVGYRADELFCADAKPSNLLARHELSPLDLLGKNGWKRFTRIRRLNRPLLWISALAGAWTLAVLRPRTAWHIRAILSQMGILSTEHIRETLNNLLKEKLAAHYAEEGRRPDRVPERVLFRHLDPLDLPQCATLKVIATNVTNQRMEVFGTEITPDVEVAEAVAASIAIPLVFRPARITSHPSNADCLYVDGGLVSNLPVWAFEQERRSFERGQLGPSRLPTLAFTLEEKPTASGESGVRPSFLANLARSAIFGGQDVTQTFIDDLSVIPLKSSLSVLKFDLSWKEAREAFLEGNRQARYLIRQNLTIKASEVCAVLDRLNGDIQAKVTILRGTPLSHIRLCVVEPFGQSAFRVAYSLNMDDDPDDRMILDKRNPAAPLAYLVRSPTYLDLKASRDDLFMTKYERAQLRPSLRSIISVPVFREMAEWLLDADRRSVPLAVLAVDSDEDLSDLFNDDGFRLWLCEQSAILSSILSELGTDDE